MFVYYLISDLYPRAKLAILTNTSREVLSSSITTKKNWVKETCRFREKCTSLKNEFSCKKCITRVSIIFFENHMKAVKESWKLSELMCYTLKNLKNWWNNSSLKMALTIFFLNVRIFSKFFGSAERMKFCWNKKIKKHVWNIFWSRI